MRSLRHVATGNAAGKGLGVAWSVRVWLTSGAHVKSPPDTPTTGLRLPQKGIPRDLPSFAGWVQSLTYGMALLGLKGHKGHSSERGGQTRASFWALRPWWRGGCRGRVGRLTAAKRGADRLSPVQPAALC